MKTLAHLLEREDEESNDEPNRVSLCENLFPARTLGSMLLLADRSDDLGELCLDVRVVRAGLANPREVVERRVLAVLGRQPPGRFLEEGQEAEHDAHGHQLEADGDPPLHGAARSRDEGDAVVDLHRVS